MPKKKIKNILIRFITLLTVAQLVLNDPGFSFEGLISSVDRPAGQKEAGALSSGLAQNPPILDFSLGPYSIFNIFEIGDEDLFDVIGHIRELGLTSDRMEEVGFAYMSLWIARLINTFGVSLTSENMMELLEEQLSSVRLEHFKWREIERDDKGVYTIRYSRGRIEVNIRYVRDGFDLTALPGRVVRLGIGNVRLVCEPAPGSDISGYRTISFDINSPESIARNSNVLSLYTDRLLEEVADSLSQNGFPSTPSNIANIIKTEHDAGEAEIYGSKFFSPLYELLFFGLSRDFSGAERFIEICRRILEQEGAYFLRNAYHERFEELNDAFTEIKENKGKKDFSLKFYGIILNLLFNGPREMIDHIYQIRAESRKGEYFRIGKKGLSYHSRGDGVIRAYSQDISFIYKAPQSQYLKKLGIWERAVKPKDNSDTKDANNHDARKVENAVSIWREKLELLERENSAFSRLTQLIDVSDDMFWGMEWEEIAYRMHYIKFPFERSGDLPDFSDSAYWQERFEKRKGVIEKARLWDPENTNSLGGNELMEMEALMMRDRIDRFERYAAILVLPGISTKLLFSDTGEGVIRLVHVGRNKKAFYFSKRYIAGLDSREKKDMEELAFWMDHAMRFLVIQDKEEEGAITADVAKERSKHFSLTAIGQDDYSHIMDIKEIQSKLRELVAADMPVKFTTGINRTIKGMDIVRRVLREDQSFDISESEKAKAATRHFEDFVFCRRNLYHCEALGLRTWSEMTYRALKKSVKTAQRLDPGGYNPIHSQIELVFLCLFQGSVQDLMSELDTLLTGRGFPRKLKRSEYNSLSRGLTPDIGELERLTFEKELRQNLRSHGESLYEQDKDAYERLTQEISAKLESFFEDPFGGTEFEHIEEDLCEAEEYTVSPRGDITFRHNGKTFMLGREYANKKVRLIKYDYNRDKRSTWDSGFWIFYGGATVGSYRAQSDHFFMNRQVAGSNGAIFFNNSSYALGKAFSGKTVRLEKTEKEHGGAQGVRVFWRGMEVAEYDPLTGEFGLVDNWLVDEAPSETAGRHLTGGRVLSETHKKLPERTKKAEIDPAGKANAQEFIYRLFRSLIHSGGIQGKEEIVIGIENSFIPEELMTLSELQRLVNAVIALSQTKGGLPRVIIERGRGRPLVEDLKRLSDGNYSRIIVLGDKGILEKGSVYNELIKDKINESALLAGVQFEDDLIGPGGEMAYLRLLEMLTLALKLSLEPAGGNSVSKYNIDASAQGPRKWLFIPVCERMNSDDLLARYRAEIDILTKA